VCDRRAEVWLGFPGFPQNFCGIEEKRGDGSPGDPAPCFIPALEAALGFVEVAFIGTA